MKLYWTLFFPLIFLDVLYISSAFHEQVLLSINLPSELPLDSNGLEICQRPIPKHPPLYRYFRNPLNRTLSIFNSTYYTARYRQSIRVLNPYEHFVQKGMFEAKRTHPSLRTLKIILMTKDEWPALKSWILYHGDRFGFQNLYIIDGSSRKECLEFLEFVQTKFKINLIRSSHGLDSLEAQIQELVDELSFSCDYVTKLDTDEFIAVNSKDDYHPFQLHGMLEVLDKAPYDGRLVKFGYVSYGWVNQEICDDPGRKGKDIIEKATLFSKPHNTSFKSIIPTVSEFRVDLGYHYGSIHPDFQAHDCINKVARWQVLQRAYHYTELVIVHFHYACVEDVAAANQRALISHQYIYPNDTKEQMIEKLTPLADQFPKKCQVPSCHKVADYLKYLQNSTQYSSWYYATKTSKDAMHTTALLDEIKLLEAKYFSGK